MTNRVSTSAAETNGEDALGCQEEQNRRRKMLTEPHVSALSGYVRELRSEAGDRDVPDFDPLDGGIHARVLIVLESPGPKAAGTGFVSRDNPDPTARRLLHFLASAGISRGATAIWNTVPWYVGPGVKLTPQDRHSGRRHLATLVRMLNDLQIIVLAGGEAHSAQDCVASAGDFVVLKSPHPGNLAMNGHVERKQLLFRQLCVVAALLEARGVGWVLKQPLPPGMA